MKFIFVLILFSSLQGCGSSVNENKLSNVTNENGSSSNGTTVQPNNLHTVTVLEVIQVVNYSYLRVKEGENEFWIAAPTIDVKPGVILYYEGGMQMIKFESKELKKTFDSILFVDKVSTNRENALVKKDSIITMPANHGAMDASTQPAPSMGSSKDTVKLNIAIEPAKNGISIATLLKNPKQYEGKLVIIKGKVTKYTAGVMGKNWIHLQDGTKFNEKFEIVITTSAEVKDGETVTFEGPITLNKDLGYGYFFEVLMEDGKLIK